MTSQIVQRDHKVLPDCVAEVTKKLSTDHGCEFACIFHRVYEKFASPAEFNFSSFFRVYAKFENEKVLSTFSSERSSSFYQVQDKFKQFLSCLG